jgi:hypothetical protein
MNRAGDRRAGSGRQARGLRRLQLGGIDTGLPHDSQPLADDWRDGVREATDAYRAIHGDRPVTAGLAARARTSSRT